MNMEICSANTACFDLDLLRSLDISTDMQEKDWSVVLYHNIVFAHGGQRDVDDFIILRLRILQRLPVMETKSAKIDPGGGTFSRSMLLESQSLSIHFEAGDSWLPRESF